MSFELITKGAKALIAKTSASSGVETSSSFAVHEFARLKSSCSPRSAFASLRPRGKAASFLTSSPGATQSSARSAGSDVVGALAVHVLISATSSVTSMSSDAPSSSGKDALPMALRNLASLATVSA